LREPTWNDGGATHKKWVIDRMDQKTKPESKYLQVGYYFDYSPPPKEDLSPINKLSLENYFEYSRPVHDLEFKLPENIETLVEMFFTKLNPDLRRDLETCGRWLEISHQNFSISKSIQFASMVNAIEVLVKKHNFGDHKMGSSKKFAAFIEHYIPEIKGDWRIDTVYDIRSHIYHFGYMMNDDKEPAEWGTLKKLIRLGFGTLYEGSCCSPDSKMALLSNQPSR
jgi:hypothetical protein